MDIQACAVNYTMTVYFINTVNLSDNSELCRTEPTIHDHAINVDSIGGAQTRNAAYVDLFRYVVRVVSD